MEHIDKLKTIRHIRPNASFIMRGDEVEWLDTEQTQPSESEIEAGLVSYKQWLEQKEVEQAQARAALLAKLGITEEEAQLLLGGN
jgi:hypothetical protein